MLNTTPINREQASDIIQGPTCKKAKLDEVLVVHCSADLVTKCLKKKIKTLSVDLRFRLSAENECPFTFSFYFRR